MEERLPLEGRFLGLGTSRHFLCPFRGLHVLLVFFLVGPSLAFIRRLGDLQAGVAVRALGVDSPAELVGTVGRDRNDRAFAGAVVPVRTDQPTTQRNTRTLRTTPTTLNFLGFLAHNVLLSEELLARLPSFYYNGKTKKLKEKLFNCNRL